MDFIATWQRDKRNGVSPLQKRGRHKPPKRPSRCGGGAVGIAGYKQDFKNLIEKWESVKIMDELHNLIEKWEGVLSENEGRTQFINGFDEAATHTAVSIYRAVVYDLKRLEAQVEKVTGE